MRLVSILFFLSVSPVADAQRHRLSLSDGLHLDFSGRADLELIVQKHSRIGDTSDAAPWEVVGSSRTRPIAGIFVNGSFHSSLASVIGGTEDSTYSVAGTAPSLLGTLPLRLREDSGQFLIDLPAPLRMTVEGFNASGGIPFISVGSMFRWEGGNPSDSLFVEMVYYPDWRLNGERGAEYHTHFYIADSGIWAVPAKLFRFVPRGSTCSFRFHRARFQSINTASFRYEASVFEGVEGSFTRR